MRSIAIMATIQTTCIVLGWCALAIILRFHGYPDDNPMVRWSPVAIWLREFGWWLLMCVPLWVTFAVAVERRGHDGVVGFAVDAAGALIVISVILLFGAMTLQPFKRTFLW